MNYAQCTTVHTQNISHNFDNRVAVSVAVFVIGKLIRGIERLHCAFSVRRADTIYPFWGHRDKSICWKNAQRTNKNMARESISKFVARLIKIR